MANIWDVTLTDNNTNTTKEFPTLPAGRYQFEVVKVTGKEYQPRAGSKIGRCAELDLQLRVEGEGKEVTVFDRLYSDPKTIWKMTNFAKCIGVFKAGMTPGQLLRAAETNIGWADFTLTPATNEYPARNEVKAYVVPEGPKALETPEDLPF